jgi:hypothetical protein
MMLQDINLALGIVKIILLLAIIFVLRKIIKVNRRP